MARSDHDSEGRTSRLSHPGRPQSRDGQDADAPRPRLTKTSSKGVVYVDYKDTESLRRFMSANGKMQSRRRNGASAREQRLIARAVKRARFMALLPFVETTI